MGVNLLFLIFLTTLTFVTCDNNFNCSIWSCTDFYWREYHGSIPHDAVPVGNDRHGNPRYIGLIYIQDYQYLYLPATIFPKQQTAEATASNHVLYTKENVKILCGPYFYSAFEWIPIQHKDLSLYTSTRPVISGGSEVWLKLYIGRVFRDNDAIVGKIIQTEGIWFAYGGKPVNSLTYDLLVYNCQKTNTCGIVNAPVLHN